MKKTILYTFLSLITAAIVGTILMVSVYALPIQKIRHNAQSSADTLLSESHTTPCWHNTLNIFMARLSYSPILAAHDFRNYPTGCFIDNFTDSIIFNNASFIGRNNTFYDALTNPRVNYGDTQALNLYRAVNANTLSDAIIINYPRFWHGYLTIIKPLLLVLDLNNIRILNILLQTILLLFILYQLTKRTDIRFALTFFFTILYLNPVSLGLSINYSLVYNITLISIVYIMLNTNKIHLYPLFLWIGMATTYFNFLSAPLLTLGLPLIIYLSLSFHNTKTHIKNIFISSVSWSIGYFGYWFEKWLIATLFTSENTIKDGLQQTLYRMFIPSTSEAAVTSWTPLAAILNNISQYKTDVSVLFLLLYLLIITIYYTLHLHHFSKNSRIIPLLLVGLFPFIWYTFLINHSIVHPFMSYRILTISFLAFCFAFHSALKPCGFHRLNS